MAGARGAGDGPLRLRNSKPLSGGGSGSPTTQGGFPLTKEAVAKAAGVLGGSPVAPQALADRMKELTMGPDSPSTASEPRIVTPPQDKERPPRSV